MSTNSTLADYDFIAPAQWQVQYLPDHILLTQSPEALACRIQILSLQPSSGDLEQDAKGVFGTMYAGWGFARTGARQYVLCRGFLPRGLEYFMMEAQMNATSADGRYLLEDGAALVVRTGSEIVIIAVRHGGLLAHTDCVNKYETWRRFFNSFTVKNAAPVPKHDKPDVLGRIVGVWSQSESQASSEYVFAANGHYGFSGALGTSFTTQDFNYESLHLKTYAFEGDGSYGISGNVLTLTKRGRDPEQARLRFEQVNHGGTSWKDRLYLLTRGRVGEFEVCYEKKDR